MKNRYLLLDRDETLNHDPGYLNDYTKVSLKDGVIEGLKLLKNFNFTFYIL